jgi:hypothetical protein
MSTRISGLKTRVQHQEVRSETPNVVSVPEFASNRAHVLFFSPVRRYTTHTRYYSFPRVPKSIKYRPIKDIKEQKDKIAVSWLRATKQREKANMSDEDEAEDVQYVKDSKTCDSICIPSKSGWSRLMCGQDVRRTQWITFYFSRDTEVRYTYSSPPILSLYKWDFRERTISLTSPPLLLIQNRWWALICLEASIKKENRCHGLAALETKFQRKHVRGGRS